MYRHPSVTGELVKTVRDEIRTLQDFVTHAESYADENFIGKREVGPDGKLGKFVFKTYRTIIETAKHFGAGVAALKLCKDNDNYKFPLKFISIFAPNIEPWYIMDIGCMVYGYTLAPIYATLGPDSVGYVLNQTESQVLGLVTKQVELISQEKTKGNLNHLKYLIVMDKADPNFDTEVVKAEEAGFKVFTFEEVCAAGEKNFKESAIPEVKPDLPYTLCYTSGTTGDPKGAVYTHGNIVAQVAGIKMSSIETD